MTRRMDDDLGELGLTTTVEPPTPAAAGVTLRRPAWRMSPRGVVTAAGALIAVQLAVRAWGSLSGFLYWDDFILAGRSARYPLLSTELLLTDHDGHFMPGGMAVTWVLTRLAPLQQLPLTVVLVLAQLLASVLVLRMLRVLFGDRPLILVPLALYLFSPLTLPSFLWWSAAINALPLQIGLALAITAHVRYLQTGRRRHIATATASIAGALLFFEKSVLIIPLLVGISWIWDTSSGPLRSLARTLRTQWAAWLSYLALLSGYLILYGLVSTRAVAQPTDWAPVGELIGRGFGQTVVPALVGGPLAWTPTGYASAIAAAPRWLVWVSWQVVLVAVVVTGLVRPRAFRAWTVLALYVVLDLLALALGRSAAPALALLAQSERYTADAAVVAAVCIGYALMTPVGETPDPRGAVARRLLRRLALPGFVVATVAVWAFVLLAALSTTRFVGIWAANPARPWVQNARTDLAHVPDTAPLLASPVPEYVLYGLAYPANLTSSVLAPLKDRPSFGDSTSQLRLIDESGHLVVGRIDGVAAEPGSLPGCGTPVRGATVLTLEHPLFPWEHTVRLGYLAGQEVPVSVSLTGGQPVTVTLHRGLNDVFVQVQGGGSWVFLTPLAPNAQVCVGDAAVGDVVSTGQRVVTP